MGAAETGARFAADGCCRDSGKALNYEIARIKLRKLLKRLTSTIFSKKAKNSDRGILAEIAALSLTAPLPLAEAAITQGDFFDGNMVCRTRSNAETGARFAADGCCRDRGKVQTLTEATRRVSSVAADVLASRFIQRQLQRRDSGGEADGITVSRKLLNRAAMAGQFFRIHKETDLRPLLLSTVTRMWCELHTKDVQQFRKRRVEELPSDGDAMAVDGEVPEDLVAGGLLVSIAGKNRNYPNELAGYIRDKEYIERLLELVGGCPRLPEAGALTVDQIYAQAGGPLLKAEVMLVGDEDLAVDVRAQRALSDALRDPRLLLPLLLIPAKVRAELLYDAECRTSMQAFAAAVDDLQKYHLQLLEYLSRSFSRETYKTLLPPHEKPPLLASEDASPQVGKGLSAGLTVKPAAAAAGASGVAADDGCSSPSSGSVSTALVVEASFTDQWKSQMVPLLKPSGVDSRHLDGLSLDFLLLFWRLSLEDIIVPNIQYETSLNKLENAIHEVPMVAAGAADFSRKEEDGLRKKRGKLKLQRRALLQEWEEHKARQAADSVTQSLRETSQLVKIPLIGKSDTAAMAGTDGGHEAGVSSCEATTLDGSIPPAAAAAAAAATGDGKFASSKRGPFALRAIIKYMLAPRVVNSEADALFCAHFVWLLVGLRLPLFNFLDFMNIWTRMLVPIIRSSTEREAQMLGLFVAEILSPLRRWLQDEQAFEKETAGNCCFALTYRFSDNKAKHCHLTKGAKKWESRIFDGLVQSLPHASAATSAPDPSSWLAAKAAVVFLSRCHDSFPLTYKRGVELMRRLSDALTAAQGGRGDGWGGKAYALMPSALPDGLCLVGLYCGWHSFEARSGQKAELLLLSVVCVGGCCRPGTGRMSLCQRVAS
ncbi:hypothetical protein cyc_08950 [Cyclospora cayetanensis]|uniref:THO complex subunitTHOC2 C-terminal domain-containing protein n=1 Tax=Cyclospora cayetanensis TaxID=88456 RepID=A0A1D3CTH6_9EIME|nr:hypothetical protein cyc_08950 [Cyclospora cayetanensis]